jgi:hypothetical protein
MASPKQGISPREATLVIGKRAGRLPAVHGVRRAADRAGKLDEAGLIDPDFVEEMARYYKLAGILQPRGSRKVEHAG